MSDLSAVNRYAESRSGRFLAVDWGTTNRRIFVIGEGLVEHTERDDLGAVAMTGRDWSAEVAALRQRYGDLLILLGGMAGSTRGWKPAPYLPAPVTLDDLAEALVWVEPGRTAIVPGVASAGSQADLMRGEEVQLLGAVAAGLAPPDALLCQPGTHCKWARMSNGSIREVRTMMTGEIFALLRAHSLLGDFMKGPVRDDADFQAGVELSRTNDALACLFSERARVLLGRGQPHAIAGRVSGLLIGHDVATQRLTEGEVVHVLADVGLGDLYAAAIAAFGGRAELVDSHAGFVAGITAIREIA